MTEKEKEMEIATFRFGIISEFVTGVRLERGEKEKLYREKTSRTYKIPYSSSTRIGRSTIKKWISDYKNAGMRLEGLMPSKRKDAGTSRSISATLQSAIKKIREDNPRLTAPAIIKELQTQKHLSMNESISLNTLYGFLKRNQLQRGKILKDRRAFEASYPNELWQSDVLHGPMAIEKGKKKKKTYLIAIMDDHSRLVPWGKFYFSEKLHDFKDCLKNAIERKGLPQKLYIDNGACYKALNLEQVTASLGIGIVHTPPYTPQGRGKIERWFRYVRESFLATLPKNLTLDEINERFFDWLEEYHRKVHSATKQTPLERYQGDMKCVRPVPARLLDYFRFNEIRLVRMDRTFQLGGVIYEAPMDLIGRKIEARFHRESPEDIEIFFEGRSFGKAVLLNKKVNFKVGRNNEESKKEEIKPGELFQKKEEE